jgi:hypothetical protein
MLEALLGTLGAYRAIRSSAVELDHGKIVNLVKAGGADQRSSRAPNAG